jgi:hypothetical protein
MTMKKLLQDLRFTLPRYRSELNRAKAEHPALASYADAEAVLAALAQHSALSDIERDAIVRALVLEKQSSTDPLWGAMLILVFQPALLILRGRVHGRAAEDVDQAVVESLLEAAASVRGDVGPLVLTLHRATVRKFFQRLRARTPRGEEVCFDDQTPEVPWHLDQPAFVECAAREVLFACERVPGATAAALARAGLTSTLEQSEIPPVPLGAGETRRMRDRVRHRHARAIARVRKTLRVDAR